MEEKGNHIQEVAPLLCKDLSDLSALSAPSGFSKVLHQTYFKPFYKLVLNKNTSDLKKKIPKKILHILTLRSGLPRRGESVPSHERIVTFA